MTDRGRNWAKGLQKGLFKTSLGWWAVAWAPKGLSALVLAQPTRSQALRKLTEYLPPMREEDMDRPLRSVPAWVKSALARALAGKSIPKVPIDLSFLTPFQEAILHATAQIPLGQTRTYAWTARRAGSPKAFRAAGQALHINPISILIPCHRVIAFGNRLGGYGGGMDWKIRLLKAERISLHRAPDGTYKVSEALLK